MQGSLAAIMCIYACVRTCTHLRVITIMHVQKCKCMRICVQRSQADAVGLWRYHSCLRPRNSRPALPLLPSAAPLRPTALPPASPLHLVFTVAWLQCRPALPPSPPLSPPAPSASPRPCSASPLLPAAVGSAAHRPAWPLGRTEDGG